MKIFALDSDSPVYQQILEDLAEFVSIDLFEDVELLFEALHEGCDAVFLNFDSSPKQQDKNIKKLKKTQKDLPIFLYADSLDPKKMAKHQNSKTGANIYFQSPFDLEMAKLLLEPFLSDDLEAEDREANRVIEEHNVGGPVSESSQEASDKIDSVFSSVFLDEYADRAQEQRESKQINDMQEFQGDSVPQKSATSIDLLAEDFDLDEDEEDLNIPKKVDMEDKEDEMIDDLAPLEEDWQDDSDLSIEPEDSLAADSLDSENFEEEELEELESVFPDENDLTFPDNSIGDILAKDNESNEADDEELMSLDDDDVMELGELSLSDGEEEPVAVAEDDQGMEMDLAGDDDLLDLAEGDEVVDSVDDSEDGALELGGEEFADLDLGDSDDEEPAMDLEAGALELGDDLEADGLELGEDLDADALDLDDGALDLSGDDEEINLSASEEESLEDIINLDGGEEVLGDELDLSDFGGSPEASNELTISEDSNNESQVFSLEKTDTGIKVPAGISEESLDDGILDLSSKDEEILNIDEDMALDELEGALDLSGDDSISELLDSAENIEDELTRPAFSMEAAGLEDGQDLDDDTDEASMTKTELGGASISEELMDLQEDTGKTIMGVNLEQVLEGIDPSERNLGSEEDEIELGGDSGTSVSLDDNLSGVSLTGEDSNFDEEKTNVSFQVASKLAEIDNQMVDEIEEEDKTLVAGPELLNAMKESSNTEDEAPVDQDATLLHRVEHIGAEEKTRIQAVPSEVRAQHYEYVQGHDEELVRLGETIKNLREDRQALMEKIDTFEHETQNHGRDFIGLQAQLDEKKIELAVVRKRLEKQNEDLKFQLDIALDKKEFLTKQNQQFLHEVEKLSRQKKMDMNQVRAKERELEEKLEMLRRDAEVQIRNRDSKILELKRRIDSLEFDIEGSTVKERKSANEQLDLEDKMNRVIKTLRGAIGQLEDDYGMQESALKLKNNLDV